MANASSFHFLPEKGPSLGLGGLSFSFKFTDAEFDQLWEEPHLPGPPPSPGLAACRRLTGTGAKPADPGRLRPLLPADTEAVVHGSAEHRPFLGAVATGYRTLQAERYQLGPASHARLGLKGLPKWVTPQYVEGGEAQRVEGELEPCPV